MASICNDDWASLGVMSGHERKTLGLSGRLRHEQSDQVVGQQVNPQLLVAFICGVWQRRTSMPVVVFMGRS